jgi:hypothetical protein
LAKKRVGRPTIYKKEYCKKLIDYMAQGLSFESFAGELSVNRDTLYEWRTKHPQFSDAYKIGKEKRNQLAEKIYFASMTNPVKNKTNTPLLIFWVKNVLGWRDKVEYTEHAEGFDFGKED